MNDISAPLHPSNAAIARFPLEAGELQVGGLPLSRLAQRVGTTPFFAYDRRLLTARIDHLRRSLPQQVALSYAVKANPMPAVVQHLAHLVDGFDVASALEMKVAVDTPMRPQHVSFAGPGKRTAELAQAIAAGVVLHVESEGELTRIADLGNTLGLRPQVALRVNPDFELKASGMRMGGGPQQFGIDVERLPQVLGELRFLDLEFLGFHIYAGSQNLSAESLMLVQEKTIDLAMRLSRYAPDPVRHLNIGGGFGVPYFPKDRPLDVETIGHRLGELLNGMERELPEARVIIELGRYIVGECGIYVARIVDRKESRGEVFLVTDGGLNHQLAASGNFGQKIRRNYPVAIGNRMAESAGETASVVGCLCTPLDLLADRVMLPRADVGDLVVIFQSGAYGLTASPSQFLGHPPSAEVLV